MRYDGLLATSGRDEGPRVVLIAPSQPSQNVTLENKRLVRILQILSQTSQSPNQDRFRRPVACQRPNLFAVLAVSGKHRTTKAAIDLDRSQPGMFCVSFAGWKVGVDVRQEGDL